MPRRLVRRTPHLPHAQWPGMRLRSSTQRLHTRGTRRRPPATLWRRTAMTTLRLTNAGCTRTRLSYQLHNAFCFPAGMISKWMISILVCKLNNGNFNLQFGLSSIVCCQRSSWQDILSWIHYYGTSAYVTTCYCHHQNKPLIISKCMEVVFFPHSLKMKGERSYYSRLIWFPGGFAADDGWKAEV